MRLAKMILSRVLIVLTSIGVTLIMLEIAVRLFAPVTDYPLTMFYPVVGTHYRPNQEGIRRFGADGAVGGRYHFNGEGWNSLHEYDKQNDAKTLRIALVGDSFVEGLQVDVNKHADTVIERRLNANSACQNYERIQVYNFGVSGSPLSQYLNMVRYASANYPADIYVVNIVFNDIDQSWKSAGRSDFMTFRLNSNNDLEEVPAKSWVGGRWRPIAIQSALFRYLYFNLQIKQTLQKNLLQSTNGQEEESNNEVSSSGPEINATPKLIETILGEMQHITSQQHADLLITVDTDRLAIYTGTQPEEYSFKYAPTVLEKAKMLNIAFIDLTKPFTTDYRQFHQRFDFPSDYHWNERGHQIMGDTVADWIARNACQASTP